MAASTRVRRGNKAADEAVNPEGTEDTENTDSTETTEGTEGTATETTEATSVTEAAPIDLGPFQTAVQEAATKADSSTGMVSEADLAGPRAEYAKLDGAKAKRQAKVWIADRMKDFLNKAVEDPTMITQARAYMLIQNNLVTTAAKATHAPATPADKTADLVSRVVALNLAQSFLDVPEGVAENWRQQADEKLASLQSQAQTYREWAEAEVAEGTERPDAPEVDPIVVRAYKLAAGRAAGKRASQSGNSDSGTRAIYTGTRRSVEKHIASAFADKAEGDFLTIAAIAGHTSDEYGSDHPSSGAVSAALFGADGSGKVKGGAKGAMHDGRRGAVKVAA